METTNPIIQEFDYRPHPWLVAGAFLLAGAGAVLLGYFSIHVKGGTNVRGIDLTEEQLRWFFRILFLLSPIGLVPLGAVVYAAFFRRRRIALTRQSLLVPKPTTLGLSRDEDEIPFADIRSVRVDDFIGSAKLMRIEHTGGAVSIASNMFRSRKIFAEVVNCVESAVADSRSPPSESGGTAHD